MSITGVTGFIDFHLAKKLSQEGYEVFGIDSINAYYDVQYKLDRLGELKKLNNFQFQTLDITDKSGVDDLFKEKKSDFVVNLAAKAGVRYSIEQQYKYINANLKAFINLLEACRNYPVKQLASAFSSSVYGLNRLVLFSETDYSSYPVSLYTATKKANEMMAHSYTSLYDIPCSGLRFFSVYGPWWGLDMAYFKFTKSIFVRKPIDVYNNDELKRDFTYIDDIVEGIGRLIGKPPLKVDVNDMIGGVNASANTSITGPFRVFNIGDNKL